MKYGIAFGTTRSEQQVSVLQNSIDMLPLWGGKLTQEDQLQNKEDPWKRQSPQFVECGILGVVPLNLLGRGKVNDTEYQIRQ